MKWFKEEKEAKRIEALNRRRELQKLHDEEMSKLVSAKTKNQTTNANKLTQAQIAAARERLAAQQAALEKKNKKGNVETVDHLEDNPNIVPTLPSGEREEVLSARTVEEAIGILRLVSSPTLFSFTLSSINDPTADATSAVGTTNFSEYAKKMMPILKQEYPELRDRQLTDKCFKMYQRAAENPRNQAKLNAK